MTHIINAMKRGMHVISVNKGPLALAFPSLMEIAEYNHVLFRFSEQLVVVHNFRFCKK